MPYVYLAVGALLIAAFLATGYVKRRRDEALRLEARAVPIKFAAIVAVKVRTGLFGDIPIRGELTLRVRGGFIEVSNPFAPARVLLGQEFYLRANGVKIETGVSSWGRDSIVISGNSSGKDIVLIISERKRIKAIWDAMVDAGAAAITQVPISPQVTS